jgi:hypothetical protein
LPTPESHPIRPSNSISDDEEENKAKNTVYIDPYEIKLSAPLPTQLPERPQ